MVSVAPLKEKFLDVELRELPSRILMWDFIPKHCWRISKRSYRYYNRYFNIKGLDVKQLNLWVKSVVSKIMAPGIDFMEDNFYTEMGHGMI